MEISAGIKGRIAELRFIAQLLEAGYDVFGTSSEDCRYDLIFESEGEKDEKILHKVQIKKGQYKETPKSGSLTVPLSSHKRCTYEGEIIHEAKSYKGQIDHLGVYCKERNRFFLISEELIPEYESKKTFKITKIIGDKKIDIDPKVSGIIEIKELI